MFPESRQAEEAMATLKNDKVQAQEEMDKLAYDKEHAQEEVTNSKP
jgi:hypothetical protein